MDPKYDYDTRDRAGESKRTSAPVRAPIALSPTARALLEIARRCSWSGARSIPDEKTDADAIEFVLVEWLTTRAPESFAFGQYARVIADTPAALLEHAAAVSVPRIARALRRHAKAWEREIAASGKRARKPSTRTRRAA